VTRPLYLLYLGSMVFPFVVVFIVIKKQEDTLSAIFKYLLFINAFVCYLTILSYCLGQEISKLGSYAAEAELKWFKFCVYFNFGYFLYSCLFVETILSVPAITREILLNFILAIIGFISQLRTSSIILSYPVQMANVLETWQQQEGGKAAKFIKPLSVNSLISLHQRLGQYYEHEQKRNAKSN